MIVSGEDDEEEEYYEQEQQQQQQPTHPLTASPPAIVQHQQPPLAAAASTAAPPTPPSSFSPRLSPPAINTSFTSSLFSFPAPTGSPRQVATSASASASSTSTNSSAAQPATRAARPPRPTSLTATNGPAPLSAQQKQRSAQSAATFQSTTRLSLSHTNATSANVAAVRDGLMGVLSGAQEAAANVRVANETARRLVELMRQLDVRMSAVRVAAVAAGESDDSEQHALP